jgi:hypothetical protein
VPQVIPLYGAKVGLWFPYGRITVLIKSLRVFILNHNHTCRSSIIRKSTSAKQVTDFLILIQQSKLKGVVSNKRAGEQAQTAQAGRRSLKALGDSRPIVVGVKDGSRHGLAVMLSSCKAR